jgi:hypothetical protein
MLMLRSPKREQPVVRDHDERVALLAQFLDAGLGLHLAPLALEGERPGHHADGEGADLAGDAGHDGGAAGTGAAALAARHEAHVGAAQHFLDLVAVVLGGVAPDVGVGAGTEAAGELAPDVELHVGIAHQQRLGVGVDGDELDALEAHLDHAVDGIDAAAADADHLDDRQVVVRRCHQCFPFTAVRWSETPIHSRHSWNKTIRRCWGCSVRVGGPAERKPSPFTRDSQLCQLTSLVRTVCAATIRAKQPNGVSDETPPWEIQDRGDHELTVTKTRGS